MPRHARLLSESGYYHVIVRGVGQQILFEEDQDYLFFLDTMEKFSNEMEVGVCAYCLMSNHVHMLLCDYECNLSIAMKKIGVRYSNYFNTKYERTGHLFQDRFLSEPICSEQELIAVFRYILNNPVKAGICKAKEYPWSSYFAYGKDNCFVDTFVLEGLIGSYDDYARLIEDYHNEEGLEHACPRMSDETAINITKSIFGSDYRRVFDTKDKNARNEAIAKLKRNGLSIRQIERITGVSRGVIQRAG